MKYVIMYFAMLALTSPCYATVQTGDIVKYEGATFSTPVFPLEQYGPSFVKEDQEEQEAKAELIITIERGNIIKVDDKRKSRLWLRAGRHEERTK